MKIAPIESSPFLTAGRRIAIVMVAFLAIPGTPLLGQQAQPETHRKAVQKSTTSYPAAARAMNLSGTVRVAVKVAANGRVLSADVLGGHPLLAEVAVDAVRQWRFEITPQPTEEVVLITFKP